MKTLHNYPYLEWTFTWLLLYAIVIYVFFQLYDAINALYLV